MSYTKNPHKYPPELIRLLDHLAEPTTENFTLQCENERDAMNKKIMIHAFFRAVCTHADELILASQRLRMRQAGYARRPGEGIVPISDDVREAQALAEQWEKRALTSHAWMVTSDKEAATVTLKRRTLKESTFGESLMAALNKQGPASPPPPSDLDDQLALLRQATAKLEQGPDLPPEGTKTV